MTTGSMGAQEGEGSASEAFWEDLYAQRAGGPGAVRPNAVLVDVAGPLPAGRALDLGCGEGGDALWLAGRGWQVTAVDVSASVLARNAHRAERVGLRGRIDWQQHDLCRSFPAGTFDLVSAQYFQTPVEGFPRDQVLRTAAVALAPGGLLLVVDHGSVAPWSWADPDTRFPTAEQLLAALELPDGPWQPVLLGSPERQASGPDGQSATVTDTVVAARRPAR